MDLIPLEVCSCSGSDGSCWTELIWGNIWDSGIGLPSTAVQWGRARGRGTKPLCSGGKIHPEERGIYPSLGSCRVTLDRDKAALGTHQFPGADKERCSQRDGGSLSAGTGQETNWEQKKAGAAPIQGFLLEFLPHGKRREAGNRGCGGGRSCGKLVEGFWDGTGALWDQNPPKGSWWAELGWWELLIQLCSRSSAGEGRNSMEKLRGRGEDREALPHHS